MAVFTDVVMLWPGNAGTAIPTGWSRETAFDTKFIKGWNSDSVVGQRPGDTGGTITHSHVGIAHTHSPTDTHYHTVSYNQYSNAATFGGTGSFNNITGSTHNHDNSNVQTMTNGTASSTVPYAGVADNNAPPHKKFIFVKGSAGAVIATDMIGFWNSATVPNGWYFADGNNSTQDCRNIFPRGADVSGNSNMTPAGSDTHTHVLDHSHSTSHGHTGNTGFVTGIGSQENQGGAGGTKQNDHQHTVTLNETSVTTDTYTATLTSGAIEPPFKKLLPIQRKGGKVGPRGIIGLWLKPISQLNIGWKPCDGGLWEDGVTQTPNMKNFYLKFANTTGEIGDTTQAGITVSATHAHAASNSHSHSNSGTHNHTGSTGVVNANSPPPGGRTSTDNHNHTINTVGNNSTTLTWGATTMSAESVSNEPEYVVAAFIQLTRSDEGGAFLYNLI